MQMQARLVPTFFSMRFSISGFILRSCILLELSFEKSERCAYIWILLHAAISFLPAPFVEDAISFPVCIDGFFAKIQVFIGMQIYVGIFNSIPLIDMAAVCVNAMWFSLLKLFSIS